LKNIPVTCMKNQPEEGQLVASSEEKMQNKTT